MSKVVHVQPSLGTTVGLLTSQQEDMCVLVVVGSIFFYIVVDGDSLFI